MTDRMVLVEPVVAVAVVPQLQCQITAAAAAAAAAAARVDAAVLVELVAAVHSVCIFMITVQMGILMTVTLLHLLQA